MSNTYRTFEDVGAGAVLNLGFPKLSKDEVVVEADGVVVSKSLYTWTGASQITLRSGYPTASVTVVRRLTDLEKYATQPGSGYYDSAKHNANDQRTKYAVEEVRDHLEAIPDISEVGPLLDRAEDAAEAAAATLEEVIRVANTVLEAQEVGEALQPTIKTLIGDGATTEFDLENTEYDERHTQVFIHGVYQQKNTYAINAGIITFDEAPPEAPDGEPEGNVEVVIAPTTSITYAVTTLPEGTTAIELVATNPTLGNYDGRTVYNTTDKKTYTYKLPPGTWSEWGSGGGGVVVPEGSAFLEIMASLPVSGNFEGRLVYNKADKKWYYFNGLLFLPMDTVGEGGGGGGGGGGGAPEGATFIELVDVLPALDNFEGRTVFLRPEGVLYVYRSGAWSLLIGAIDAGFPPGFTAIQLVSELPATDNFEGRTVYLSTDFKLYVYRNGGWSAGIDAEDILGQITATQISDGAITTPKLAALSVVAGKLAANSVMADNIGAGQVIAAKIAAGNILAAHLAANSVAANNIQAGAVTAAKISVSELSAISANLGSIMVDTLNIADDAVIIPATAQTAGALSVDGSGFNLVQNVTLTVPSNTALLVLCGFRCTTADDVDLDVRSGSTSILSGVGGTITIRAGADMLETPFFLIPRGAVSGTISIGFWLRKTAAGTLSIRNRRIAVLGVKK